jgi:hypothetical protein
LMKSFRTHRCALDFDTRFVQAALTEEDAVWTLHRRTELSFVVWRSYTRVDFGMRISDAHYRF